MRSILTAILIVGFVSTSALAQSPIDKVPDDAIVVIRWCGADALPASYDNSHLKALLDHSQLRELFSEFLPAVAQKLSASQPQMRAPIALGQSLAAQLWRHPTVLYCAGVNMADPNQPVPKIAILCAAGKEADALDAQLNGMLAGNPVVHVFRQGDLIAVAVGYADAKEALAGGLSTAPAYTAAMKQVQADAILTSYVDVEKGLEPIESMAGSNPQARAMVPRVITALGLRGLKRMVYSAGFDGQDWMTQSFTEAPQPRSGLLALFDAKPVSADLLKVIPADATFVATARFDPAKLVAAARAAAQQIGPEAQQGVEMVLGMVQIALGRNLVTDIFEPLGDDWAMYCSPSISGNGVLGMVIVNKLDDPAKAASALPTAWINLSNWASVALLRAKADIQIQGRSTEIEGQKIYYIGAPIVAPAWTIKDGYLYMGLYPQPLATAARWPATGAKSIAASDKFMALQKRLGVSNPCSISYYDLPTSAAQGSGYQQLLAVARYAGFGDIFGVPMPEPVIPPLDILQQHLTPAGSMAWVDTAGYHVKSISPFPASRMLSEPGMFAQAGVGSSALMVSILLPSLNRARETANRVKCAANMKAMGLACLQYAADHRGKFPDKIGDLVRTEDITAESFVCPSGNNTVPPAIARATGEAAAAWVDANADYVYFGAGRNASIRADEILIYEKPGHHGNDGINILYGDGHVDWESMNRAAQLIDQQAPPK